MLRVIIWSVVLTVSSPNLQADEAPEPLTVSLWNGEAPVGKNEYTDENPTLTIYRPKDSNGTAIVICPGGGYGGLAIEPEGHGIARWLNQHGITGLVLKYRLPKGRTLVPLLDALRAIRMARVHSDEWGIKPSKVGVMGFSAGGHLASTCATQFSIGSPESDGPYHDVSARPDFAILIYPVITMGEHTHGGSKRNLLGVNPSPNLVKAMSSELRVTRETPPTFLAHAIDDRPVPPINSELFYRALKEHDVPSKFLELPNGGHGLNGYRGPSWDAWQKQSLDWLAELSQ